MQITPDWNKLYPNAKALGEDLNQIKFEGPGLYVGPDWCAIITPEPKETEVVTPANVWNKYWPEDTPFRVHHYACTFEETCLGTLGRVPTRN